MSIRVVQEQYYKRGDEIFRLREALQEMVYEATHLSPEREDGAHDCRMSKGALGRARAALSPQVEKAPQPSGMSRELMGLIVDEVFNGAIEDASVIEEIYAVIKRHEAPQPGSFGTEDSRVAYQRDHASDDVCQEADGCPTEMAVLKRFWRQHQKQFPIASEPTE